MQHWICCAEVAVFIALVSLVYWLCMLWVAWLPVYPKRIRGAIRGANDDALLPGSAAYKQCLYM